MDPLTTLMLVLAWLLLLPFLFLVWTTWRYEREYGVRPGERSWRYAVVLVVIWFAFCSIATLWGSFA